MTSKGMDSPAGFLQLQGKEGMDSKVGLIFFVVSKLPKVGLSMYYSLTLKKLVAMDLSLGFTMRYVDHLTSNR